MCNCVICFRPCQSNAESASMPRLETLVTRPDASNRLSHVTWVFWITLRSSVSKHLRFGISTPCRNVSFASAIPTCREVTIIWCIWCVSTVGCNIGEVNPHFAEEALANSWAATTNRVLCHCCICLFALAFKSTRTAHVYIPNTYYACAWRHRFQRFPYWVFTRKR